MLHVEVAAPRPRWAEASDAAVAAVQPGNGAAEPALVRLHLGSAGWCEVPLLQRRFLVSGQVIHGPALISEAIGCIVLEAGWTARLDKGGVLLLDRLPSAAAAVEQEGDGRGIRWSRSSSAIASWRSLSRWASSCDKAVAQ